MLLDRVIVTNIQCVIKRILDLLGEALRSNVKFNFSALIAMLMVPHSIGCLLQQMIPVGLQLPSEDNVSYHDLLQLICQHMVVIQLGWVWKMEMSNCMLCGCCDSCDTCSPNLRTWTILVVGFGCLHLDGIHNCWLNSDLAFSWASHMNTSWVKLLKTSFHSCHWTRTVFPTNECHQ